MIRFDEKKRPSGREISERALCLVGNFQFHAAVKDVGFEAVEGLDFRIPGAVSQVFYRNIPEGIPVDNGMNAVTFCCAAQLGFHICPKGIHTLAVLREPVHHIGVVGSDTFLIAFTVAEIFCSVRPYCLQR